MVCSVRYCIEPKSLDAHLFEITITLERPDPQGQRLSLPVWIPGSYMLREFARHIVELRAHSTAGPVAVLKTSKDAWLCAPSPGPLHVSYCVYAGDPSVRGAFLDRTRGYFNGASVFLRVHGKEAEACTLAISPPAGAACAGWRVATAMPRREAEAHGFGLYEARDYEELLDHPVEMGEFSLGAFQACGVPHEVAVSGRHSADMERLCNDLKRLCEYHIRFFGESAPFADYLFLVSATGEGYGGLEHRASCSLVCARDDLPRAGGANVSDGYRSFLGLCSHEYFHAGNVKRIKPAAFTSHDLAHEAYTRLLWAFEGITSYYDDLALVRCGLISPPAYLELLGKTATRVWRTPGRRRQTLEEASFDAWIKFYRPDENSPNATVSYYTKGALVAACLDLLLRSQTDGRRSLDDVMRTLWTRFGQTGLGVPEDGVEAVAKEVGGIDLTAFFDGALRGTEELPLGGLLASHGVSFRLRAAEGASDEGGKPGSLTEEQIRSRPALGVRVAASGEAKILAVFEDGAAQAAGLAAGDVIVAIDGLRVSAANWEHRVHACTVGLPVPLFAFRGDLLLRVEVVPQAPIQDTCVMALQDDAGTKALALRAAWLDGG